MENNRGSPCIHSPHTCTTSPTINILNQSGVFDTIEPIFTHHYHPKPVVYIGVYFRCCTFHGVDKSIMTCIYHSSLIQGVFYVLGISVLCLFISPSPQSLATANLFAVFILLPFPEYHIVKIKQYVAFSD